MKIRLNFHVFACLAVVAMLNCNFSVAVTNFGSCVTPNQVQARCIPLEECTYLYELLQSPNLSHNDRTYLSRSQCGYRAKQILICCPDTYLNSRAPTALPLSRPESLSASAVPAAKVSAQVSTQRGTKQHTKQGGILPQPPQCGKALTNRIYGGNLTHIDEFPWLALIEYTKPNGDKGHYCGGTLISDHYVLTAAHCVVQRDIPAGWTVSGVRLGEWDTRTNPDCEKDLRGNSDCAPEHVDVEVEKTIPHPEYANRNQPNDIALVRLTRSVTYSDFIKPICLPTEASQRTSVFLGTAMDVAGWGATERSSASPLKLKATVTVRELDDCQRKYSQLNVNLEDTQMCAGGVSGIDSCRGDSGGPLMVELSSKSNDVIAYLVGVVSFGPTPCGLQDWPGVYTRVGAFMDWIQNNVTP